MTDTAYLVLENGEFFEGFRFGASGESVGELVFTTGMTGYLETLTDPSYCGQIILQTFPLIGNYGVIPADFESATVSAGAYIVKYPCQDPSNFRSEGSLDSFLKQKGIVGLYGIDTRAVVRMIREKGVMNAQITTNHPDTVDFAALSKYKVEKAVESVTAKEVTLHRASNPRYDIALWDFGRKKNIERELIARGCNVWVFPAHSTTEDIMSINPNGIMLSNGPGDPANNTEIAENLTRLMQANIPMFGICLGHQLMALASGFKTEKLRYGHRGANHPVKDLQTGRVYITSQNHGYSVIAQSINSAVATQSFVNVNDKTCEGISYKNTSAFSVQFHPEACAGPTDTAFLFDRFIQSMEVTANAIG